MARELISKKTRYEFREYFVGWTLREIEMEFDAADVPFDADHQPSTSGARRSLVEQYYHAVDWSSWSDVRHVVAVFENVLSKLEDSANNESHQALAESSRRTFTSLRKWIERDGFLYRDGRLIPRGSIAGLPDIEEASAHFDAPELQRQIDRMRNAVDEDPGLAIGTAKELVETTCKTILQDRDVEFSEDADLVSLVKLTRKTLGLLPADIADSAKGVEVIRRLLSNLGTIAQGLGELRNIYGTGHGRSGKARGLSARHARLAVGAATTIATFLFETHQERE